MQKIRSNITSTVTFFPFTKNTNVSLERTSTGMMVIDETEARKVVTLTLGREQ